MVNFKANWHYILLGLLFTLIIIGYIFSSLIPIKSTFVGDSITMGNELKGLPPNIISSNQGISGDTTEGVLNRIEPIMADNPDYIFLMIGINDILHNYRSENEINSNMDKILKILCNNPKKIKVVVISILPTYGQYESFNQKQININSHTQSECKKYINCRYSDIRHLYITMELYQSDGLHLSPYGYKVLNKKISELITKGDGGI